MFAFNEASVENRPNKLTKELQISIEAHTRDLQE